MDIVPDENFTAANPSDATLPASWNRVQSTASTAFLNSTQGDDGSNTVTIKTNPSAGWQAIEASTNNSLVSQNQAYAPTRSIDSTSTPRPTASAGRR